MIGYVLRKVREFKCEHDWELLQKVNKYWYEEDKMPYKTTFLYRCKKCGAGRQYDT